MLLLGNVTPVGVERCYGLDSAYLTPPRELVGGDGIDADTPFGDHWGRPIERLRAAARRLRDGTATPAQILGEAAAEALASTARLGGNSRIARALADLTVTGRAAWAAFRGSAPTDASVLPFARDAAIARSLPMTGLEGAVRNMLDRAYVIAWNLRGPLGFRERSRAAQGWIASSSEDDPPHRPLNVVSSPYPQYDVDVTVGGITVTTRVVVGSSRQHPSESFDWSRLDLRSLPADRELWIPPEDDVIVFIQGHTSRAEEALGLTREIHAHARRSGTSVTVLAFDMPSNGYSAMIDPEAVAPIASAYFHLAGPLRPTDATYPALNFVEDHIRALIDELDRRIGIKRKIIGVVGGSLGGNMALRLGYRSDVVATWGANRVAWSPASAWGPSWGGASIDPAEYAGDPHRYYDHIKHEAVRISRDRAREAEETDSRKTYFKRVYKGVGIEPPQAGRWYRDGWCDKEETIESTIRDRMEIYNELQRRWHWRIAHEQLIFSHFEPLSPGGRPRYESMRGRLMLAVGVEDNAFPEYILDRVIGDMAPALVATGQLEGRAFGISTTGHSVQSERPNFWARAILDFCADEMWALRASNGRFVSIARETRRLVADSNMIGDWQRLRVIRRPSDDLAFEAASGHYVTAEGGGGREIVANRTAIRSWELFELVDFEGPTAAIRTVASTGRPARYWTLQPDGEIHATGTSSSEDAAVFHVVDLAGRAVRWSVGNPNDHVRPSGSGFAVQRDAGATFRLVDLGRDEIALRAPTGRFVSAVNGGGGGLVAEMLSPGRWGVFTREAHGDGWHLRTDSGGYLVNRSGELRADGTRAEASRMRFTPQFESLASIDPELLRRALGRRFPFVITSP